MTPSDEAQLQALNQALAANELTQAARLAFVLAKRGILPIMQLIGLASLMNQSGQGARAAELYHLWLNCTESPLLFAAWYNLGVLQIQADEQHDAEQSLRAALAIKPDFIDARMALGTLQERLCQHEAALASWRAALAQIDPDQPASRPQQIQALNSVARVAALRHHYPEAEDACARSLQLDPRQPEVMAQWIGLRQQQCAWPVCAPLPGLTEADLNDNASAASALCLADDPAAQLAAAARHAVNRLPQPAPLADEQGYVHRRLRIGYLCASFGRHRTARLYPQHERTQFDIYGFSWGEQDPDSLQVTAQMDHHIRLSPGSDLQAAQTIRAHEIDILVDLHGLDEEGRPAILAHRPAPVQVAWPGHAGSSAMPAMDYLLADAFALPPSLTASFTEQALYLPDCAQVHTGNTAEASPSRGALHAGTTRDAAGLPSDAFVFCSFASARTLTPQQFASWMRILRGVPDSVLWLAAESEPVRDNLRMTALRHGVASERLIFAPGDANADVSQRIRPDSGQFTAHAEPQQSHLPPHAGSPARQPSLHAGLRESQTIARAIPPRAWLPLADLCLDTYPCSSPGASADALQAGIPVLTLAGRSHAARTSGSLLHAARLPELVARSARSYEDKAIRLASRPQELARLRRRLARNRDTVFDTPALVRHLEALYLQVARGTLQDHQEPRTTPDVHLPLVSILIPFGDHDSGEAIEATVHCALEQDYARCEIILSDSSHDDSRKRRLTKLLAAHPRLRYNRAPALPADDNLDHCLTLALGDYIAVAPPGDLLHAGKISRMMHFYLAYPGIGLVACWRQPVGADGAPLPALRGDEFFEWVEQL
ncbi:O-linked N-acetylglucosamine transferase family protein, partial [Duganella callida]